MLIQLKVCIHNCFIVKYDIWIAASIQRAEVNHYTLCRVSQQEGSKQRLCPHWQQKLPTATTGYADWSTGQQKDLDPLDPRAGYKWVRKQSAGITLSVESAFRSRQHICLSVSNHVWTRKIWQGSHQGQVSIITRRPAVPRRPSSSLPS